MLEAWWQEALSVFSVINGLCVLRDKTLARILKTPRVNLVKIFVL